jgi:hypothetical protein
MADSIAQRLEAIQVATMPARWRLLGHAVTVGPFAAAEAADVAHLPRNSGNARSHAERLCEARLLEREQGRAVRYRATPRGYALYNQLEHVVAKASAQEHSRRLARGQRLDLITEVSGGGRHKRAVIFRITRRE